MSAQPKSRPADPREVFLAHEYQTSRGPLRTYHLTAYGRIEAVQSFSLEQCETALKVKDLQLTVRRAIERRMRKLRWNG